MKLVALPWIILFLPLLATALITLFTLRCKTKSSLISISAVVTGFVLSLVFIYANGWHPAVSELHYNWLSIDGGSGWKLDAEIGLKLDALSMMMLLIVT